jgi:flavin reductase (DIM6/NTAB) family NADH-FMN oxidoreductase RutF
MHRTVEQIPRSVSATLWAALIAPRPIALISSQNGAGLRNIAPYNSFCGLATHPPMLGISLSRRHGERKQTGANIAETGVFVVNLVPRFLADIMNEAAQEVEGMDDFERLNLTAEPGVTVDCPRIAESPASLECRLTAVHALPPSACEFVVAEILGVYIRDEFVTETGGFDPLAADLLASVGAEDYLSLNGETLFLPKIWGEQPPDRK